MGQPEIERRKYGRTRVRVPIEFRMPGTDTPNRCSTQDISAGGCYIEMMQPFPVGTTLEMTLQAEDDTLLAAGTVVTCDPHVGNGIELTNMLPEDRERLKTFLASREVPPESS